MDVNNIHLNLIILDFRVQEMLKNIQSRMKKMWSQRINNLPWLGDFYPVESITRGC